ncbi:glycosyltransferase family 2 protein [Virgibacillus sp. NKC19-3]|uniref:glycosyltransferase family 2 protein n=1 Tax=Virgibacillus saliphilus TaxID=2831674 RepID=UPI001C9AF271|nr:glycosyltransferase family 2 protein [Virgibacillus sp. NKC19-3]MBY7144601.1 glycosyltransferase family 2 protein [Virgibacillus sp. NKC19-3]
MNFSVIIPLYNKERYVKRAINSVLEQTHQEFEIIVVDDGSTDSSYEKAKSVKDSRIRVFRKKNNGVSSARNYGIRQASYEYIGFLDADDMWKPLFLETINSLIMKYPKAGAYGTLYEFVNQNGEVVPRKMAGSLNKNKSGTVNYFKESLNTPLLSASSVVIPKYAFKEQGVFPEGIARGEDLDMWRRIALHYEVAYVNKICVTYFLNVSNMATKKKRDYNSSTMKFVEEILISEKKNGPVSFDFEEYMISKIINKARYLIEQSNNQEARKLLWKYKYTKYNKKKWLKNYILSFRSIYILNQHIKNNKTS